jgi:hypothetical protein
MSIASVKVNKSSLNVIKMLGTDKLKDTGRFSGSNCQHASIKFLNIGSQFSGISGVSPSSLQIKPEPFVNQVLTFKAWPYNPNLLERRRRRSS